MQYIKSYQCTECGTRYPVGQPMNLCPKDQRPVQLELDLAAIAADYPGQCWYQPDIANMWRFGPLLPFDISAQPQEVCTLGEGHTPLIDVSQYSLCQKLGLTNVQIKDEGQAHTGYGANPTGSFKDRGMAMVTTMAKHYQLQKLAVPTQGNAGDSLAEYGHQFGLQVAVVMPDDTPQPIMDNVADYARQSDATRLNFVQGTIREAGEWMKRHLLPLGYFNCATFQEPGWRIEGKKTMGLELAEPVTGGTWRLPDAIFYPTGGGTGILGMWKAFDELQALGVIDHKRPKIISVQSEQNPPLVTAMENGWEDTRPTQGGDTQATGINVPGGVGHKAVLRILRQSGGAAIAVSEEDIANHTTSLFRQFDILISPEGAATIAALQQAKDRGLVKTQDHIVCFNTGSASKYWPQVKHLFV